MFGIATSSSVVSGISYMTLNPPVNLLPVCCMWLWLHVLLNLASILWWRSCSLLWIVKLCIRVLLTSYESQGSVLKYYGHLLCDYWDRLFLPYGLLKWWIFCLHVFAFIIMSVVCIVLFVISCMFYPLLPTMSTIRLYYFLFCFICNWQLLCSVDHMPNCCPFMFNGVLRCTVFYNICLCHRVVDATCNVLFVPVQI